MIQSHPAAVFPMDQIPTRRTYDTTHVRSLFNSIASRYDFLNHLLSFGVDFFWRTQAIKVLKPFRPKRLLDVATGTGDLALKAAQLLAVEIIGVDVSPEMLKIGRKKVAEQGLSPRISLLEGTAENLSFSDESFDAVTVAFGVRNFTNLERGLHEMHRVLRKNAAAVILEFSKPTNALITTLFGFYFRTILPIIGGFVSKNKQAYRYLPNTVGEFPAGVDFLSILHKVGFSETIQYPLTFGIATIYIGIKK